MTELQQHMVEEVAEDYADGTLTRRETVRCLSLLGVSMGAAASLLAAAPARAGAGAAGEPGAVSAATAGTADWAPVRTEDITFSGPSGTLMAAWAPAASPRGALLVVHENRGLNDHIRRVAGRFAAGGLSALALDLLSEEGGAGSFADEAAVVAALAHVPPERFVEDMRAAVTELHRRLPSRKAAATGFGLGGGLVWRLLAAGEKRLAAAAPFYGAFPAAGDLSGAKAAVLGVYGGRDVRVNATREAARAALEAAHLKHLILTFTEADPAFFNDTSARFDASAAAEAYRQAFGWFDRWVG